MTIFESLRFGTRVAAFAANTITTLVGLELAGLVYFKRKRIDLINIWLPRWARINLWIFGVKVDVRDRMPMTADSIPRSAPMA